MQQLKLMQIHVKHVLKAFSVTTNSTQKEDGKGEAESSTEWG